MRGKLLALSLLAVAMIGIVMVSTLSGGDCDSGIKHQHLDQIGQK